MNDNLKKLIYRAGGPNVGVDGTELPPILVGYRCHKFAVLLVEDALNLVAERAEGNPELLKIVHAAAAEVVARYGLDD